MSQREKTSRQHHAIVRVVVACVLALLWMAVIFWMSANNADDSAAMSAAMSSRLLNILFGWADPSLVAALDRPVRKFAHFAEYALLGALLANVARAVVMLRHPAGDGARSTSWANRMAPPFAAWLFGALYAVGDEAHQTMVPGRSMQVTDICIDAAGVLVGVVLFWAVWRALRHRAEKRECAAQAQRG